jgi:hypothetical protein
VIFSFLPHLMGFMVSFNIQTSPPPASGGEGSFQKSNRRSAVLFGGVRHQTTVCSRQELRSGE